MNGGRGREGAQNFVPQKRSELFEIYVLFDLQVNVVLKMAKQLI